MIDPAADGHKPGRKHWFTEFDVVGFEETAGKPASSALDGELRTIYSAEIPAIHAGMTTFGNGSLKFLAMPR